MNTCIQQIASATGLSNDTLYLYSLDRERYYHHGILRAALRFRLRNAREMTRHFPDSMKVKNKLNRLNRAIYALNK